MGEWERERGSEGEREQEMLEMSQSPDLSLSIRSYIGTQINSERPFMSTG